MIRTRFAPSPTGYLHIGGVRTALFSFLYARSQKGEFLLRIEDTDRERSKKEFEDEILSSLAWLGLQWDGGFIHQSERLPIYRAAASELLAKGLAYEETADGKTAVKFRMPKREVKLYDLIRGEVTFDSSLFDDLVILKSDGYPTYHFACVMDDHASEITHVIRGEDHLSNTPRQMLLYEAFGWKPPKYAHLPLILGDDGTPLSKRHGAVALSHYRKEGYLPEALLNYLALLGWGEEGNKEFYSVEDLIKKFSLKRVSKSAARFNLEKLDWMNAQYLKNLSDADYLKKMEEHFQESPADLKAKLTPDLLLLFKTRIKTCQDLLTQAAYCFQEVVYPEEEIKTFSAQPQLKELLKSWMTNAGKLVDFEDIIATENLTRETAESQKVQAKELIHPLRFAFTGKTVSPGLFELMKILGQKTCIARVRKFLDCLST